VILLNWHAFHVEMTVVLGSIVVRRAEAIQHWTVRMYDEQAGFDARFEWGIEGVRRLGPRSDVLVIVDVLSFSTAVDIAVGRGARVLPFSWRDERATGYARDAGALLAGGKRQPTVDEPYTLSPSSLTTIPSGTLLVLPSPNGSTLSQPSAPAACGMPRPSRRRRSLLAVS
jgi:2-phosphosulfolactate phosphatase